MSTPRSYCFTNFCMLSAMYITTKPSGNWKQLGRIRKFIASRIPLHGIFVQSIHVGRGPVLNAVGAVPARCGPRDDIVVARAEFH